MLGFFDGEKGISPNRKIKSIGKKVQNHPVWSRTMKIRGGEDSGWRGRYTTQTDGHTHPFPWQKGSGGKQHRQSKGSQGLNVNQAKSLFFQAATPDNGFVPHKAFMGIQERAFRWEYNRLQHPSLCAQHQSQTGPLPLLSKSYLAARGGEWLTPLALRRVASKLQCPIRQVPRVMFHFSFFNSVAQTPVRENGGWRKTEMESKASGWNCCKC